METGQTSFAYDAVGNLTGLTDPVGNTTNFVFDGLYRMTEETNSLSKTRFYQYDAVGNLTELTDRNGRVREFDYDGLDRQTQERWLNGSQQTIETFSYQYDALGRLLDAQDSGSHYSYQVDALGRVTQVDNNGAGGLSAVVLDATYDAVGNRTQLAATVAGSADFQTDFTYDHLHRVTRIEQAGQGGNAVAAKRVDLAYNGLGQFTSITRYADVGGSALVAESVFGYDAKDRLTDLTHQQGVTILADYDWSYDALDRVTQFVQSDGVTSETADYSYDDTSQLISEVYDYQPDLSYTYDANGNRTMTGYQTGTNNRLLNDGTFTYTYDDEGNRLTKTETATGESFEYTWDHRNRLTKIVDKDSGGAVEETIEYAYDVFDRRIEKTITPDVGPAEVAQFAYDGEHIILRFENGNLANRYLHGPVIDQILADEQVSSTSTPGDVLWPLTDNLGTVRDLAEYDDVTGVTSIANHIDYDAFGNVTAESNAAVDHIFGYTGREVDEESDLMYYRARYYDPAAGRFVSEDPIGFAGANTNLTGYVNNSPTTNTDPSGLKPPDRDKVKDGHKHIEISRIETRPELVAGFGSITDPWSVPITDTGLSFEFSTTESDDGELKTHQDLSAAMMAGVRALVGKFAETRLYKLILSKMAGSFISYADAQATNIELNVDCFAIYRVVQVEGTLYIAQPGRFGIYPPSWSAETFSKRILVKLVHIDIGDEQYDRPIKFVHDGDKWTIDVPRPVKSMVTRAIQYLKSNPSGLKQTFDLEVQGRLFDGLRARLREEVHD